jgi:hypothetical protein
MSKSLAIKVAGSPVIHDVVIEPGTTAKDILDGLDLQGFLLIKGPNDLPIAEDEEVYPLVKDGSKLYASTIAEAG